MIFISLFNLEEISVENQMFIATMQLRFVTTLLLQDIGHLAVTSPRTIHALAVTKHGKKALLQNNIALLVLRRSNLDCKRQI